MDYKNDIQNLNDNSMNIWGYSESSEKITDKLIGEFRILFWSSCLKILKLILILIVNETPI